MEKKRVKEGSQGGKKRGIITERGAFLYISAVYKRKSRTISFFFFFLKYLCVCDCAREKEKEREKRNVCGYIKGWRVTFPSSIDPCVCVYISIRFGRK